ncbi:hypothetical protein Tco_0306724 [Tanacetum coccineum]
MLRWNSHVKTVGHAAAYEMPWKTLKKDDDRQILPKSEIKKLKIELQNLKVKGTDVVSYTQHFQELALMYGRMFLEESDEVEKYVRWTSRHDPRKCDGIQAKNNARCD